MIVTKTYAYCLSVKAMQNTYEYNPLTFLDPYVKKVSCWPANDASGRSSAVAELRTATSVIS
jgi:hypothetical protein